MTACVLLPVWHIKTIQEILTIQIKLKIKQKEKEMFIIQEMNGGMFE